MAWSKLGFKRYVPNDQKEAQDSQFKILVEKTEWLLQNYFIWTKIVQFYTHKMAKNQSKYSFHGKVIKNQKGTMMAAMNQV